MPVSVVRRGYKNKKLVIRKPLKLAIQRIAKRQIAVRQELKYKDSTTAVSALTTTPILFQLSTIPQGDSDTTRDGDKLYLKSIYFRGNFLFGDTTNIVRFIVFQWKPNSTPLATSILLNGTSGFVDVYSNYNHDNRQEYHILKDMTVNLVSYGQLGVPVNQFIALPSNCQKPFKFGLSKFNHQLQYVGGTTTGTNQIYWLAMTDSSILPHPNIQFMTRFLFTDS